MARSLSLALLVVVCISFWDLSDGGAMHYNEFYSLYTEQGTEKSDFDFEKCSRQPPLGAKVKLLQVSLNPDGDDYITEDEFKSKFYRPFDMNNDNCISIDEWMRRSTFYYRFSNAYSERIFIGDINEDCALNISRLVRPDPGSNATLVWNEYVQALIGVCDADTMRYCINDDCAGLPELCKMEEYKDLPACLNFNPAVQKCMM